MSDLEDARSGLSAKLQELFRKLGIDLNAPGDARSPAERLSQAAFPDLEPRAAKHALESLWRQDSRWAAMEDERLRSRASSRGGRRPRAAPSLANALNIRTGCPDSR